MSAWADISAADLQHTPQWTAQVDHQQLANGFRYVAYQSDDASEPFNLRLVVNVGSVDDTTPGIAHMVEHMVFRTNQAYGKSLHAYFDELGWKTGVQINAMTRQTETQFMVRTRPHDALNIAQSVKLLADIAFHAEMKAPDWQVEKKVILEELRLGDSVASRINDDKKRVTRHDSRYALWPTIGYQNTIEATTSKQVKDFYHQYYRPSNMVLIASGHFEKREFEQAIKDYFAPQPWQAAPKRDYLELPLKDQLYIGKVQDPHGSTSAVTMGFRSAMLPKGQMEGLYQRLQNYFLRKLINKQVRASSPLYADQGIDYVSAVVNEPTNQRLTIALSAKTSNYQQGLQAIVTEVERLRQNGLDPDAFNQLKKRAQQVLTSNQSLVDKRNYAQWEDKINSALMQESVVEDNERYTQRTRRWLNQLTLEEVNARLRALLSSEDQFVFYQLPGGVEQALPTQTHVRDLQRSVAKQTLNALVLGETTSTSQASDQSTTENNGSVQPLVLPTLTLAPPRVISKRRYLEPKVSEWNLANGHRLVWLDRNTPDGELYIKTLSNAGYLNDQFPAWLTQTGLQIWQQADLDFAASDTWQQWQKAQGVNWSWAQKADQLDVSAAVKPEQLDALFKSFYVRHHNWHVSADALAEIKRSLTEQAQHLDSKHAAWQTARDSLFQSESNLQPTLTEIDALSNDDLNHVIRKLSEQPSTVFLVGKLDESLVRRAVLPYLANLSVTQTLNTHLASIAPGRAKQSVARYDENKASVIVKSQTPTEWTPERSFLVSTLTPIMHKYLKNRLRHQMGGVYRIGFEMTLDIDNQLRSELTFNSAPDNVNTLLEAASEVMAATQRQLSDENYPRIRRDVHFAEQLRLQAPTTWLRRLALSYQRYDSPQYLRSMLNLEFEMDAPTLQSLAQEIFPQRDQATLISLPKSASSTDNLEIQNVQ